MQVNLDFAESLAAQVRQRIEILCFVFLNRIEERMPRRAAVTVAKAGELARIILDPALNAGAADLHGRPVLPRLIVIGETQQYMHLFTGSRPAPARSLQQIGHEPAIHGAAANLPGEPAKDESNPDEQCDEDDKHDGYCCLLSECRMQNAE